MTYLADVNVWIALAYDEHVHHETALEWFATTKSDATLHQITFCRVTEMGLLRLLTNTHVMRADVRSPAAAWAALHTFYQDPRVQFMAEPEGLEASWRIATRHHYSGVNFWTDAYLSAFAEKAGYTLVTFDRGFRRYSGLKVEFLPTSHP